MKMGKRQAEVFCDWMDKEGPKSGNITLNDLKKCFKHAWNKRKKRSKKKLAEIQSSDNVRSYK